MQGALRFHVALLGTGHQIEEGQLGQTRPVIPQCRAVRPEHLPASPATARAFRTLRIEWHMAELTSHPAQPARELAIHKHARSNAFRHRDHHQIAARRAIEPDRRQHAGVGRVLQLHLKAGRLLERSAQVRAHPFQIRREGQPVGIAMQPPGQTHAHAFDFPFATQALEPQDTLRQGGDTRLGVRRCGDDFMVAEFAIHVGKRHRGLRRTHVHPNNHAFLIEPEDGRTAPPRQTRRGPIDDPLLFYQFFHDE